MKNMKFNSIEHEVIYNKMMNYYNEIKDEQKNSENMDINKVNLSIETMRETKELYAHRPIKSHRKYIGKLIVFLKKVIRKCLKWYINPITEQQTIFNDATLQTIEQLNIKISNLELKNEKLFTEQNRLNEELSGVTELENQLVRINELENQLGRVMDTFNIELYDVNNSKFTRSYSQSGEDIILEHIFNMLEVKNEDRTYLDLGANHAKDLSNTYHFYENGARGVLVEANPDLIKELSFYRYNDVILNVLVSENTNEEMDFYILSGDGLSTPDKDQAEETCKINPNISIDNVIKVKSITVNDIIEKYFGGIAPQFISIDIEGKDLEVIKSINLDKYRPLVIIVETIEYRPYLPINVKCTEVIEYLNTKEYVEYAFTGINSIFIDQKYMRSRGQEG